MVDQLPIISSLKYYQWFFSCKLLFSKEKIPIYSNLKIWMFSNIFKQTSSLWDLNENAHDHLFLLKITSFHCQPQIATFDKSIMIAALKGVFNESLIPNTALTFWYIFLTVLKMFHNVIIFLMIVHVDEINS